MPLLGAKGKLHGHRHAALRSTDDFKRILATVELLETRPQISQTHPWPVKDINGKREFPIGEGKIGYIRLTQFGEQTGAELDDALKKLDKQGMQALILDLRGNPGGLLDQAAKVCEKFLPKNQLIVSTEGRHAEERTSIASSGRGAHPNLPLVILVNNGSASASEIVAGCLQDATALGVCKAIVVGEQTFGKGSVQSILPLQDGSALRPVL